MKVVFFGNPFFASKCLEILTNFKNVSLELVVTNPDKKMGRGLKLRSTSVKEFSVKKNIKICEVDNLHCDKFISRLEKINADLFIVIAYKILPSSIFLLPRLGTVNLHASLLPQYRGSSPIQYSLINGDKKTGLTTFFINKKIDAGDIIYQEEIPVSEKINYIELSTKMIDKSYSILYNTINIIENNTNPVIINNNHQSSLAPKIKKGDYLIDWNTAAVNVHNKIRALVYKGAYSFLNKKRVKFFNTSYLRKAHNFPIGSFKLFERQLLIACKNGFLLSEKVLIEGSRKIKAVDFYNSNRSSINIFGE